MEDSNTERELIRAIRAGEVKAFDEFAELYRRAVLHKAESIVKDMEAAEDITQDVFITVWTKAEQWEGNGSFRAWLFKIAVNLSLNYLRSRDRRKEQSFDSSDDDSATDPSWSVDRRAVDPEAAVELMERHEEIRKAVERLPSEKRDVVQLINEYELEPREVAEVLNVPQGTVRSRLHYARKHLRDYLAWEDEV